MSSIVIELQSEDMDDEIQAESGTAGANPDNDAVANRTMINSTASCLAIESLAKDGKDFFQSKLSVAEKLTQAHEKDVVKRGGGNIPNIWASNETFDMVETFALCCALFSF